MGKKYIIESTEIGYGEEFELPESIDPKTVQIIETFRRKKLWYYRIAYLMEIKKEE